MDSFKRITKLYKHFLLFITVGVVLLQACKNKEDAGSDDLVIDERMMKQVNRYKGSGAIFFKKKMQELQANVKDTSLFNATNPDHDERTVLHYAVMLGDPRLVKVLVQAGADINKATLEKKRIPLHLAIKYNKMAVLDVLLKEPKIDVNIADNKLCTPLHVAAQYGNLYATKALLKVSNIEVNKKNKAGETAFTVATNQKIKDEIQAKGGTA